MAKVRVLLNEKFKELFFEDLSLKELQEFILILKSSIADGELSSLGRLLRISEKDI